MPSDIDELRKELDIVDVVSDYINLQRAGNNYRAQCPFHPDKTPSFYVSPTRQIFKCFGCGVGGDAVKFVSLYENISYTQAARELARRYGIKLSIKEESREDKKLYAVLEEVAQFYHSKLKENAHAVEYLKSRGIEGSIVRKFQLGFSPSSEELVSLLTNLDALELYQETGNLSKAGGRFRDLFRNRLVIPIRDNRGRVVGFGGRLLLGDGPKYVNSPESNVFKKRELLYGLYEGLSYLREFKSAILVEGYFDVIALFQEGFKNAVATLGTSFGSTHAKQLSRLVNKVYLLFDGDDAGRKAVRLAVPHLLKEGVEVFPVYLPEGSDPHDFVLKEGRSALKELINSSRDILSLLLDNLKEGIDPERSLKDILYFLSFLKDDLKAFSILSDVSKLTKIPIEVLSARMYRSKDTSPEEDSARLSFTEKLFLKGLFELKPDIDIEELTLSYLAKGYALSILREEYYDIPEDILNLKVDNIEELFWASLERLKIDIPYAERGSEPVGVKESVREFIRNHRGGIKPTSVRKWRGKLES